MCLYPLKVYLIVTTWFSKKSETKVFTKTFQVPPGTNKLYVGNFDIDLKHEMRWNIHEQYFTGSAEITFSGYHMEDIFPELTIAGWKKELV